MYKRQQFHVGVEEYSRHIKFIYIPYLFISKFIAPTKYQLIIPLCLIDYMLSFSHILSCVSFAKASLLFIFAYEKQGKGLLTPGEINIFRYGHVIY